MEQERRQTGAGLLVQLGDVGPRGYGQRLIVLQVEITHSNLAANGPSWIAKGDKYYSYCAPNRKMVTCAPIVSAGVMKGIEVGAVVGKNGEPLITFKIVAKGITPQRAAYAINYFMARTKKKVAHFNQMIVSYAPVPRQNSLTVGPSRNLIADSGSACSFGDEGGMDCTGGGWGGWWEDR